MKRIGLMTLLGSVFLAGSVSQEWVDYLGQKVDEVFPEAVQIRRDLHRIPEICYQEKKTSQYIVGYLDALGLKVETGIAGTGIKAVLEGMKPEPVVAIRADMDALPIQENTGLPFASEHPGVMHACGHDIHMANVLIAAKMLSEARDRLPGTVVFIFQPCEEGARGDKASGARVLIQSGILSHPEVQAIVGLHNMPDFPVGTVALRPGALMANVDWLDIHIRGRSSHGAYPHQGVDAIYASCSAVMQFQSLISRLIDPQEPAVLTIGTIHGGVRKNVLADDVRMEGTVRTFSFTTRNTIKKGIDDILRGLESSHGVKVSWRFIEGSRFVKNDIRLATRALSLFQRVLGESRVIVSDPVTVGEDFADYSHQIPALFFFLGSGGSGKLHSAEFMPDEEALRFGPMLLAVTAVDFLRLESENH